MPLPYRSFMRDSPQRPMWRALDDYFSRYGGHRFLDKDLFCWMLALESTLVVAEEIKPGDWFTCSDYAISMALGIPAITMKKHLVWLSYEELIEYRSSQISKVTDKITPRSKNKTTTIIREIRILPDKLKYIFERYDEKQKRNK